MRIKLSGDLCRNDGIGHNREREQRQFLFLAQSRRDDDPNHARKEPQRKQPGKTVLRVLFKAHRKLPRCAT